MQSESVWQEVCVGMTRFLSCFLHLDCWQLEIWKLWYSDDLDQDVRYFISKQQKKIGTIQHSDTLSSVWDHFLWLQNYYVCAQLLNSLKCTTVHNDWPMLELRTASHGRYLFQWLRMVSQFWRSMVHGSNKSIFCHTQWLVLDYIIFKEPF